MKLLADVAEEVRLADTRVQPAGLQAEVPLGHGVGVLARRDVPVREHRPQTSSRRAIACAGRWNGSKTDGACGKPASSADWFSVSLRAGLEKYVCAAASMP